MLLFGDETHVIDPRGIEDEDPGEPISNGVPEHVGFGEQAVTPDLKSGLLGMNRAKAASP